MNNEQKKNASCDFSQLVAYIIYISSKRSASITRTTTFCAQINCNDCNTSDAQASLPRPPSTALSQTISLTGQQFTTQIRHLSNSPHYTITFEDSRVIPPKETTTHAGLIDCLLALSITILPQQFRPHTFHTTNPSLYLPVSFDQSLPIPS